MTTSIRSDGTILMDGQPFFPIGMYHDSWQGTLEQRAEALQITASAGFNLFCPQPGDDANLLNLAESLGVAIHMQTKDQWQQMVPDYRDHPAVFGWYISDDVEDRMTPQELQTLHDGVKALDADHVTSIGTYDPDRFGPYITIPDMACVYAYPIAHGWPISRVNQVLSVADGYGQSIVGVPQAFPWPEQRPPTALELRNMTYQMLINGVKGLLYYTYGGGSVWNLPQDAPDLWGELTAGIVPEAEALKWVYMDGERIKISDTGASDVFAAQWVYENQSYIIVVNASDQAGDVSFSLPSAITGELQPMFAGHPSGLIYADGMLSGSIGTLETHIYKETSMATLTDEEKTKIRNAVARKATQEGVPIHWVKGAVNDAAQAVEDLLVNNATAISNAINTASQPYGVTFTADEKRWIVALTVLMKYNRDIA